MVLIPSEADELEDSRGDTLRLATGCLEFARHDQRY